MLCCFLFRPAKVKEGCPHPDGLVESALLASVDPPDAAYAHTLKVCHVAHASCCRAACCAWPPA